jgi:integrase
MQQKPATKSKWKLTRRKGREFWVCRYMLRGDVDWSEKSTKKTRKREAESAAREIVASAELDNGVELKGWAEFRARYESEHLSGAPWKTLEAFQTAANKLERLCKPVTVGQVDEDMLSRFALRLRNELLAPSTIQAYRDHLMSALKWAKQVKLISRKPEPPPLHGGETKARGRAINREEAERIVMQLPGIVGEEYAGRWAWNLEGLWRSGFRIGETLVFYWEPTPGMHYVENLDGERPRIVIDPAVEKGKRNRTIPMTPDFAAMLRAVPGEKRKGCVFRWPLSRGNSRSVKTIGKRISAAGVAAGVITGERTIRKRGKAPVIGPQYATAHDWRRSFGDRWSMKVMPVLLKEMMRHSSIETTLKYYVGRDADRMAEHLWSVQGAVLGDMLDSLCSADSADDPFEPAKQGVS